MSNIEISKQDVIGYKGEVTLTVMKDGKFLRRLTAYNEGYEPLFKYLMKCLTGSFEPTEVPYYIRIFDVNNNELTLRVVPKTGTPSYTFSDNYASAVITFNVSSTILTNLNKIRIIKLYSNDNSSESNKNNPSAMFTLDEDKQIEQGSTLIVAWKMIIGNVSTSIGE